MRGFQLSVDYGTSNTVAVLRWPNGKTRSLLFDGMPALSSAVFLEADGRILVGRDAEQAAKRDPSRFEPSPKRHFEAVELLLGDAVTPVETLVAATLRRVVDEAVRTGGARPDAVVLTHPVGWGGQRRQVLVNAAARAGLAQPLLVPEAVAAAMYYSAVVAQEPVRGPIVVYSLGGGTCDVSLVRTGGAAPEVVASAVRDDFGGVDLDSIVFAQIGAAVQATDPEAWARLSAPTTAADRRLSAALWDEAQAAKESLSRQPSVAVFVPLVEHDVQLSREEFERTATEALGASAEQTRSVVEEAGVRPDEISAVFLVGGATRVPAVATVLHRALAIAPVVPEHPELVVAEGALHVPGFGAPSPGPGFGAPAPSPVSGQPPLMPVSRQGWPDATPSDRPSQGAARPMPGMPISVPPPVSIPPAASMPPPPPMPQAPPRPAPAPMPPIPQPMPPAGPPMTSHAGPPMTPHAAPPGPPPMPARPVAQPVPHAAPHAVPPRPTPGSGPVWPNQPPPAPVQPRRMWPFVVALTAFVLVAALVCAVIYAARSVSGAAQNAAQDPITTQSASPSASAEPVYAQLPDPCAIGSALPPQLASIKADGSKSTPELPFCRWEQLQTDRAVYLKIQLQPQRSGNSHDQFANDLQYAGDTGKNGGYTKNPVAVPGLGDEAFVAESFNPIIYGKTEADAKTYEMGGATVEVRARNVIIQIGWVGATYPAGAGNGKVLRGTQFTYAQTRDQAIAIARQLMTGFK